MPSRHGLFAGILLLAALAAGGELRILRDETRVHAQGDLEVDGRDPALEIGGPTAKDGGTLRLTGGSVAVNTGHARVGSAGRGVLEQTGGACSVRRGFLVVGRLPGSKGRIDLSGGTLRCESLCAVVGEEGEGGLTISGTGRMEFPAASRGHLVPEGGLWIGYRATGAGVVRLREGGRLVTPHVRLKSGDAAFVFDGGTLENIGTGRHGFAADGAGRSRRVCVADGDARIDTGGGTFAIPLDVVPESPGARGGLVKLGAGELVLSGANSWRGRTVVERGALVAERPASLPGWDAPGRIEVRDGAELRCGSGWTQADVEKLRRAVGRAGAVSRETTLSDVPWTTPGVRTTGRWHAEADAESPLSGRVRCAWTSGKTGDAVELPFAGTAVGFRCRRGGRSQVWGLISRTQARAGARVEAFVDGRSRGLFDTEAADRFEVAKGLPEGRHVLRLVNRGRDGADARVMVRCFLADEPQPAPRNWEVEDAALAAEASALPPVAFVAEAPLQSGAVPNAVWQSQPLGGTWGCAIRVVEPAKGHAVRTVFAETNALIYDLSLSYDATKALFSMRRNGARTWQVYEIGLDGTGLRQLTDTPQAHNASPVYLADDRIAFVSSRTPRYHQVCQPGPCTHLHVMDADGGNVRRLSSNTLSDFCLCPLSDGRILYTRWSYVDWNLTYRQSLWTQYPDGRQLSLWFGNLSVDPASFVQAAELPDYSGVVALFAPHHRSVYGAIGSISARNGPEADAEGSVRLWTPELPCIYDTCHFWSWCHPFPVARDRVLVARGVEKKGRYVLALLADDGRRATVYEDPSTSCFLPRPVVPRPAPKALADFVPAATNVFALEACPPGQPEREEVPLARIVVSDVNKGLEGRVARGAATHIRVMEQLPKTVNRTWNGVLDQGPLLGASSYYAKRVWSYAPIAEDGSAHLEVPALKEIYLQLVDAEGRELRRMTDALNLMPGETQSCTGCHENRRTAAAPLVTSSARRAPTPITPPAWGNAGVLDYVRVIQPVWDRNCVRCHAGANPPKGLSLAGGYTRFFNMSYDNLVLRSKSDTQSRARFTGQSPEKPLVQGLHLLYGVMEPYEAKESGSLASRLPDYLTKAHCGVEVSAADRRRVFEWIDAQIPYYATSDHAHVNGKSGRDRWGEPGSAALKPWFTKRFLPLYEKKCASCHGGINLKPNLTNAIEPQWWWFDLSRPEWSPALTAHLPKAAGGRGCAKFGFSGKDDPVFRELKDIAREASEEAWKTPEADMPGFVPLSRGKCEYRP